MDLKKSGGLRKINPMQENGKRGTTIRRIKRLLGLDRRIGKIQRNQEDQDARKSSILLIQRVWKEWEKKMDDQENQEAIHLTYRKSEREARRGVYLLNDQR